MAWELRHGQRYYYRTFRRPDGGVGRQYLGKGPGAQAAAAELEKAKAARRQDQARAAGLAGAWARQEAQAADLDRAIRELLECELLLAGHYLHAGS